MLFEVGKETCEQEDNCCFDDTDYGFSTVHCFAAQRKSFDSYPLCYAKTSKRFYVLICCGLILCLVENFSNQINFYFPLFQIMIMNMRQWKIKIKLV